MRPIQSTLLRHLAMHAMRPDVYCTCPLPPECSAVEIPITVILSVLIISVPLIAVVGVESILKTRLAETQNFDVWEGRPMSSIQSLQFVLLCRCAVRLEKFRRPGGNTMGISRLIRSTQYVVSLSFSTAPSSVTVTPISVFVVSFE